MESLCHFCGHFRSFRKLVVLQVPFVHCESQLLVILVLSLKELHNFKVLGKEDFAIFHRRSGSLDGVEQVVVNRA